MPESFKKTYPNTRAIIDCSHIKTQCPSTVRKSVLKYSSYKHDFTVVFLLAIAPNGIITFVSKCYGGRATDAQIAVDCGVLDKAEPLDQFMMDKGFPQLGNTS